MPEDGSVIASAADVHLGFVAGIILRERLPAFEKVELPILIWSTEITKTGNIKYLGANSVNLTELGV